MMSDGCEQNIDELARDLGVDPATAGTWASDLVVANRASVTSDRKYRSLGVTTQ